MSNEFELDIAGSAFQVTSVRGREAVGEPFSYELVARPFEPAAVEIGAVATLSWPISDDARRTVVAIIDAVEELDGTSNFLRGWPHFCISIALVENGEPTDGVIYDPLRNELFTASRGAGAVLNDKKIRVSDRKDLSGAMLITGFPPRERARLAPQLATVQSLLGEAEDIRRTGSAALDLAYVACGRADGYFEAGVKPWDIAAGMLLVREAGGRVCDFRGRGERLLDGGQIVAGNLKLGDALQKAVVQSGYAAAFNA